MRDPESPPCWHERDFQELAQLGSQLRDRRTVGRAIAESIEPRHRTEKFVVVCAWVGQHAHRHFFDRPCAIRPVHGRCVRAIEAARRNAVGVSRIPPAQLRAESTLSFRLETSLKVIPSSALNRGQSVAPSYSREPLASNDEPVLKHRVGSQLPDTNANVPRARRTSDKPTQQASSPRDE